MSDFIDVLLYKDIRDEHNTLNGHFPPLPLFACFIPEQGYLEKVSAVQGEDVGWRSRTLQPGDGAFLLV